MIEGSCHCGTVHWRLADRPDHATACNCTVCRRYGVLWAYGYEGEGVKVSGDTRAYIRGDDIEFHFCPTCGCVAYWRGRRLDQAGRRRMGINLRLAEPQAVGNIRIDHLDGLSSWQHLPPDGRTVADYWF